MRSVVTIVFNSRDSIELDVDVETSETASREARDWFEQTWTRLGCEPLRPSGKVLLLDKILGVADAMGYSLLAQDAGKAQEFAANAALALDRSRITVDLPEQVVGY